MRLPDANLLIYSIDEQSPHHKSSRQFVHQSLSESEPVGFAWTVLLAVIRLTTNPRVFERPLEVEAAIEIVESWLAQPCATIVQPTERHASVLRDLLMPLGTGGNLTNDAHLAALAIEHGGTLYSVDSDFSRFPGLKWKNPLA